MDNSSEKQSTKRSWITEGIVIAASPLIAYILLYSYEAGFADSFRIPRAFITLELSGLIAVSISLLAVTIAGFLLVARLHRDGSTIRGKIVLALLAGGITLPLFLSSLLSDDKLFSVLFVVVFLLCVVPLFIFPLKENLMDSLNWWFGQQLGRIGLLLMLFTIMFFSANAAGHTIAYVKRNFLVIKSSPEMVVLRIYGDKLICAPFDRTKKEVKRTFSILKTGDDPNLKLSLEKVGPLHMEKHPTEVLKKSNSAPTDSLEGLNKK